MITAGPGPSGVETSVRLRKDKIEQRLILNEYIPMHPPTTHISDLIIIIGTERACASSCMTYNTGNPSLTHLNSIFGEGSGGPYLFPSSVIKYVQVYKCTHV